MLLSHLKNLITRFRYPVSLPEEIGKDLGISLSNNDSFEEIINILTSSKCSPKQLHRFMKRSEVDIVFQHARKKEQFKNSALYSYYFNEGWIEFSLKFDEESKLRRIYLYHQGIEGKCGIEIPCSSAVD